MTRNSIHPAIFAIIFIAFGFWGDFALRGRPLGLNFFLWAIPLLITIPVCNHYQYQTRSSLTNLFLLMAALFSSVPLLRDSGALNSLCILAALFAVILATVRQLGLDLHAVHLSNFLLRLVITSVESAFAWIHIPQIVRDWLSEQSLENFRHAAAILRGILLAVPFILIFVLLFASADAKYERLIASLKDLDAERLFAHSFFTLFFSWLAFALLTTFFFPNLHLASTPNPSKKRESRATELFVVLSAIILVFASYVYIQLGYFFGGLEHVLGVDNLTLAEYARRGFFESAAAAAFALVILLAVHEHIESQAPNRHNWFTALSIVLVALIGVVIASGMQRMSVYSHTFGLTEDRFYVFAILVWLAGTFLWLAATLIAYRGRGFILGAILYGYASLFVVVLINPHAHIARVNLDRQARGLDFDVHYASTLSADAAPTLTEALPALTQSQRSVLTAGLRDNSKTHSRDSVLSWCYSRSVGAELTPKESSNAH